MTIQIRLASTTDASQILDIYAPIVQHTPTSFEQIVPEVDDIAGRITKTLQQYPWLVCEIDGQIAGYAYGSAFRSRAAYQWTTEVTSYVHPDYHRRGIGRGLYASLFAILREQGYCNAVSVITVPNDASVGLHEAMGFEPIGMFRNMGYKLARWHDTGWWQLALRPMPDQPQPPIPLGDFTLQPNFPGLLIAGQSLIRS